VTAEIIVNARSYKILLDINVAAGAYVIAVDVRAVDITAAEIWAFCE